MNEEKINNSEKFDLGLPKWPECIIWGDQITEEQALEIIRRTDGFFSWGCGNNHSYIDRANEIMRIPQIEQFEYNYDGFTKAKEEWTKKWEYISLEYLDNQWISCSCISGPHGWCQPTGKIAMRHNIGKWPEVKQVYDELKVIAEAFPFLSMTCVLSDKESGEDGGHTVVTMQVKEGKVQFIDDIPLQTAIDKCQLRDQMSNFNPMLIFNTSRENYFSLDQLYEWSKQVFGK